MVQLTSRGSHRCLDTHSSSRVPLRLPSARAAPGERAYDFKPFYRGGKVSVIGAITVSKVLGVMTLDGSMDSAAFEVYISKCLVPQLWKGAVVVMGNLPAHKVKAMREALLPQSPSETMARMRCPLIEAVGAKILYLSPYSPEFNPIELLVVTIKGFLKAVFSENFRNG